MTRIFILHMADGSRHAFDDRNDLRQTVINTWGQFGDGFTHTICPTRIAYFIAGIQVAYDEVLELHDRPTHL